VEQEYRSGVDLLRGLGQAFRGDAELTRRSQDLLNEMLKLDPQRFPGNPEMLERIRAQVLDGWRQMELELNRRLESNNALRLPAREEIPEHYRKEVEQYYRSLAQRQKK
jgi:hypothetical protein